MSPDRADRGAVGHQGCHISHGFRRDPVRSGTGYQLSAPGKHQAEGRGIVLVGIQGVAEPRQVDIQPADGRQTAVPVPDRIGVGGQLPDRRLAVFIGITPEIDIFAERPVEVGALRIVVVGTGDLLHHQPTVLFVGIGFEKTTYLRIVVRNDGDAPSRHERVAADHPEGRAEQGIRPFETPGHIPGVFPHRHLRLFQRVDDDRGLHRQFHPCDAFLLLPEQTAGIIVLHDEDQLQKESRQQDQAQAGALPLLEKGADSVDEPGHGVQDSKKRKESRIRKIMST